MSKRLLSLALALSLAGGPAAALEGDLDRNQRLSDRERLLHRIMERRSWPRSDRAVRHSLLAGKLIAERRFGWTARNGQWPALRALWSHESGWRWWARNPSSGACGIPQFLPCSKGGPGFASSPIIQIRRGARYIVDRYGSPVAACQGDCSSGSY